MSEREQLPRTEEVIEGFETGALTSDDVADALAEMSGLPGLRANLSIVGLVARRAPRELLDALALSDDDFVRMCAVMGRGRVWAGEEAGEAHAEAAVRAAAVDPSWRVREAAAMALQLLGDLDPGRLRGAIDRWSRDADPLVVRAAVAGVCEPRLLADPETALTALDACARATATLASATAPERRSPAWRTLRQALGYCWSVAVAASPGSGIPRFEALDAAHPDVAWIVSQNRSKARLRRVLAP